MPTFEIKSTICVVLEQTHRVEADDQDEADCKFAEGEATFVSERTGKVIGDTEVDSIEEIKSAAAGVGSGAEFKLSPAPVSEQVKP